ncbi:MAG: OmpA family protein [Gammaproteobacteria bacterium]|nr:OmpA family protein [Gammaproteobacteria bacterium]MCY4226530.1 OmpA family protein [Gammaproteobacteria bacterium]MCY4312552.1 OmpA family protein [Gammaproteobacteria bacterium]
MRLNNIHLTLMLASALFITACSTPQKPAEDEPSTAATETEVSVDDQSATTTGIGSGESGSSDLEGGQSSEEVTNIPRVVYFEYDSSNLNQEVQLIIAAHALVLSQNQDWNIVLEGHADERGTREYNLALSQERAQAVADLMQVYSIGLDRIQLVSYGEEEPAVLESNEEAWAKNRRVEILY